MDLVPSMFPFSIADLTLFFSAFSSFAHLFAVRDSCFAVNLRLNIWSRSWSSFDLNQLLKTPCPRGAS